MLPASSVRVFHSTPGHPRLRAATDGATESQPVALIIDELPYLIEKDDGFPADLQLAWDRYLKNRPVLLVAIGSDVRMMQALTQRPAELHNRPTREVVVPPLSPAEVAKLTGVPPAEALDIYLIVGGFPQLASSWPRGRAAGASCERRWPTPRPASWSTECAYSTPKSTRRPLPAGF